ncbi:MAG: CHAT domain-containing protein [Saprospiraceae bacterium]
MKSTLTILCCLFTFSIFGQPTGDIEKDTALANQYLIQAAEMADDSKLKIDLLVTVSKLYKPYPVYEKKIEIYSYMALIDTEKSVEYANKAIDLAVLNFNTTLHPNLYYAYKALLTFYNIKNNKLAIEYGEKALQLVEKPSDEYFDLLLWITRDYTYSNDIESLNQKTNEMETLIASDTIWRDKLPILYRTKMQANYLSANYENAINYGKQCIIENKKNPIYNNISLGPIYVEIANYYAYLGKNEEAIQWIKDGIEVGNPAEGSIELASYQANLSTIYAGNKTFDKAIEYGLVAIEVFQKDTITNMGYLHIIHFNVSNYYFMLKDYSNAMFHVKKSRAFRKHPYVEIHYANVLNALNQYKEALEITQELLIAYSDEFNNKNIYANPSKYESFKDANFIAKLLQYKTSFLIQKGTNDNNYEDIKYGILTGDLAKYHYQDILVRMKGFQKARLNSSKNIITISDSQLIGSFLLYKANKGVTSEDLFNLIEKRKSLFLLETLTPSMLPDSIISMEKALVDTKQIYEQKLELTTKDSLDFYQNALFSTNVALENLIKTIRTNYPKETKNFHYLQYAKIADIQNTLDAETIIVEYSKTESNNFYIQLISKNDLKIISVPAVDLDEKIEKLNEILQNPFLVQKANHEKFIHISAELYEVLILPIVKELGDKKKLIIIPEGKLFELTFEVLLSSNAKKPFDKLDFLIKDFDISYQYSATIYHQLKQKQVIKDNSFLGFAPVFENGQTIDIANRSVDFMIDSLYQSIDNNKFISLPNTEKEITEITKIIESKNGQTNTLLKSTATKPNLIHNLKIQPYQFIHIATHGIVNFQNPKLSALVCYDNKKDMEKSLFFANEIQLQDIQADLIVLSSCESGIGQLVAGEGLIALNRSFIYSGANNVLFSLWKVNDEHTSELMIDFYKSYYQNQHYSSALRQTKLKMLQNPITANPRFWAAFVLIGE